MTNIPPAPAGGAKPVPSANLYTSSSELFKEARALMEHMATNGVLAKEGPGKQAFEALVDAVNKTQNAPDGWPDLIKAYQAATAVTIEVGKIDGRSVLDTHQMRSEPGLKSLLGKIYEKKGYRATRWALILIIFALILEYVASWVGLNKDNNSTLVYQIAQPLVGPLIAFVWGAIGSCLFLMKRISDQMREFTFRESLLSGDGTRIVIGAIIGLVVVWIFFLEFDKQIAVGNVEFGAASAAFLSGLGVKAVYGALEQLVEVLASWLGGKRT